VIVFWDESGASLLPVTRRPGRPAATPRHRPPFQMEAGVDGRRDLLRLDRRRRGRGLPPPAARLQLRHPHRRLGQLRAFLGGQKATLVWDGLPAHRSLAMRHWLGCQRSWLVVEPLPGYAPDLNPVEGLWANLKGTELANLAAGTSPRSPPPSVASNASAPPTGWPTHSCATAACRCGEARRAAR
jgi:DDE superfamily endonuclease